MKVSAGTLEAEGMAAPDRFRAANYLSVGQIYLLDNPLLHCRPLRASDIKPRLLGHRGTTPGLNLFTPILNRIIRRDGTDMIYIAGPGHGGPAMVANAWLEGTYCITTRTSAATSPGWPNSSKQFSFPAGSRHVAPRRPVDPRGR